MVFDECQLLLEAPQGVVTVRRAGGIQLFQLRPAQLSEGAWGGGEVRPSKVGEGVPEVARQVEGPASFRQHNGIGDSIGTVTEQLLDLLRRPQEELAVRMAHVVRAGTAPR